MLELSDRDFKLLQEDIVKLTSPISFKEIEFLIKNLPKKKLPGPDDFMANSTKCLRKK